MPPGVGVSGLESDGGDRFFCGGGDSGKVQSRPPAEAWMSGSVDRAPSTNPTCAKSTLCLNKINELADKLDYIFGTGRGSGGECDRPVDVVCAHALGQNDTEAIEQCSLRSAARFSCSSGPASVPRLMTERV